jgi:hypothetical protein
MINQGNVTLRERAICAWRKERPKRLAQLLRRADLTLELRKKLEEVLGDGLPIKIMLDLRDHPVAIIEDLRFTLTKHREKRRRGIMLLDVCPRCGTETGMTINTLADLGQLFEGFGAVIHLGCTECIGLTDDELKP